MRPRPAPKSKPKAPAAPAAPRRKFQPKDLTHFARSLRLPAGAANFTPLSRVEVSGDFRVIASLPALDEVDAEADPLLADPRRLSVELRARLDDGADAEAVPLRAPERASTVQALEAAAFGDVDDEGSDAATLLEPARVMSGWVAARLVAETATRALLVDGAPGFLAAASGSTVPARMSVPAAMARLAAGSGSSIAGGAAVSTTGTLAGGAGTATGIGLGSSHGAGFPLGMSGVRLELSLKERLAALAARQEEHDRKSMALRRFYVAQLRHYAVQNKEQQAALEALRDQTAAARAQALSSRSAAFATDEEEWAAVQALASASFAVMRQNGQLRTRLAEATLRSSGNAAPEPVESPLSSVSSDSVDGEITAAHGARASAVCAAAERDGHGRADDADVGPLPAVPGAGAGGGARRPFHRVLARGAAAQALDGSAPAVAGHKRLRDGTVRAHHHSPYEADGAAADGEVQDAGNPYRVRSRNYPRRTVQRTAAEHRSPVLALGDLVATRYGRGIVLRQRDEDDMVEVRLTFGAKMIAPSEQLALLAVAGERFTGDACDDAAFLATSQPVRGGSLLDGRHNVATGTAGRMLGEARIRVGAGALTAAADDNEAPDAVAHATRKVRPVSASIADLRRPVFRSSFAHFGAPRGAPLRVDPHRGNPTAGFYVGTVDGIGDTQSVFIPGVGGPYVAGGGGGGSGGLGRVGSYSSLPGSASASPMPGLTREGSFGDLAMRSTSWAEPTQPGAAAAANVAVPAFAFGTAAAGGPGGVALAPYGSSAVAHPTTAPAIAIPPSAMDGDDPHVAGSAAHDHHRHHHHHQGHTTATHAANLQRYRAEVQRLTYQLRSTEESRDEQRARLTDLRTTAADLLDQLNEARAALTGVSGEISRRDDEIDSLRTRIGRLLERFAPEAERRGWHSLLARDAAGASGGGGSALNSARGTPAAVRNAPAPSQEVEDDDDEDAGMTVRTGAGAGAGISVAAVRLGGGAAAADAMARLAAAIDADVDADAEGEGEGEGEASSLEAEGEGGSNDNGSRRRGGGPHARGGTGGSASDEEGADDGGVGVAVRRSTRRRDATQQRDAAGRGRQRNGSKERAAEASQADSESESDRKGAPGDDSDDDAAAALEAMLSGGTGAGAAAEAAVDGDGEGEGEVDAGGRPRRSRWPTRRSGGGDPEDVDVDGDIGMTASSGLLSRSTSLRRARRSDAPAGEATLASAAAAARARPRPGGKDAAARDSDSGSDNDDAAADSRSRAKRRRVGSGLEPLAATASSNANSSGSAAQGDGDDGEETVDDAGGRAGHGRTVAARGAPSRLSRGPAPTTSTAAVDGDGDDGTIEVDDDTEDSQVDPRAVALALWEQPPRYRNPALHEAPGKGREDPRSVTFVLRDPAAPGGRLSPGPSYRRVTVLPVRAAERLGVRPHAGGDASERR